VNKVSRAAANSSARGRPSNRRQSAATSAALPASRAKSGRTAWARATKRATAGARDCGRVGALLRGGQGQRRHRELALPAHAQRGAAGHQRRHAGARPQQRGQRRPRPRHLLHVVQQQQQVLVAQVGAEALLDGLPSGLAQAQRPRQREQRQGGVAQGGEAHRDHTVGEGAFQAGGGLLGQARLADPARPRQRQQAHIGLAQQMRHRRLLALPSQQRRQRRRERVHTFPRRPIRRVADCAQARVSNGIHGGGLAAPGRQDRGALGLIGVQSVQQGVYGLAVGARACPLDVADRFDAERGARGHIFARQAAPFARPPRQGSHGDWFHLPHRHVSPRPASPTESPTAASSASPAYHAPARCSNRASATRDRDGHQLGGQCAIIGVYVTHL